MTAETRSESGSQWKEGGMRGSGKEFKFRGSRQRHRDIRYGVCRGETTLKGVCRGKEL